MADDAGDYLLRQFETASKLASYHLDGLTTDECLWRPGRVGLHVHQAADGTWRADWPEHEGYDIGPPSIGWLTWHIGFWWSMVIDHAFGDATLSRERVMWPGTAEEARARISVFGREWRGTLERLTPMICARHNARDGRLQIDPSAMSSPGSTSS
jgi:hypothetical protein